MTKKKTYVIKTLGCRANQYESAAYINQLQKIGYREADPGEKADVCIVNTCTVTQGADKDSRYQVRKIARDYPESRVVVTGCSAENDPFAFLEMPEVHSVVGNEQKDKLLQHLFPEQDLPEFSIERFEAHTRAFVKIQDGCNSYCSYCIIPFVRGRSRSKSVETIVKEIEDLVRNGYKEVVLTGINIGDFDGGDGSATLADLVRECDQLEGLERLRISSIDPDEIDEDLLQAVVEGKKTCQSMHVVLQSGSNAVLKRMNRKYTKQMFLQAARQLVAANPEFTFTTDVIVGFPGESDLDFEDTLDVIHQIQFAHVHVFPYSQRKRTRAYDFPDQIDHHTVQQRKNIAIHRAEKAAYQLREKYIGKKAKVLMEANQSGHTDNFLQVKFEDSFFQPNELLDVILKRNAPDGLIAEVYHAS